MHTQLSVPATGKTHCHGIGLGRIRRFLLSDLILLLLLAGGAGSASAQVTVNQILFPSNIGRTLDAVVTIDYTRTNAAAATISTVIPPQLSVNPPAPPAGCSVVGSAVDCVVPAGAAGDSGTLTFQVRGATLGAFSLVATGTGGSNASNTGTVRSSGELTILKSRSPAAGNLLAGQSTTFTLQPQIAAGADDLPLGATLTVTDQLPGTLTDFTVSAVNGGIASCSTVASANATRTVTCTYSGALSAAAISGSTITVTGRPGTNGNFTNVGSIAADQATYFDRDINNNTANVNYTVDPASDVQALGSFVGTPVLTGSTQTLTLTYRNNGPMNLPAGGTITTTIPADFTVNALPANCTGPATGVVLAAPAVLTCTTTGPVLAGATQGFAIPLTMPASSASGNFVVTVAPPAGYGDANPANNSVNLPYQVAGANADLRLGKSKSPASGPVAPGSNITTTLTVTNDAASTAAATYSVDGAGTEMRVVDYLHPEEIAGDTVNAVTAGWNCVVSNNADPTDATRTKRVVCTRSSAGTLAAGTSLSVRFTTTVGAVSGQVALANRACTGETMLSELGLGSAQGPQPVGNGHAGNDCATAGSNLIATDVISGQANVTVRKESSNDNATWVDSAATPPAIGAANDTQYWRITLTTPAGGIQAAIPTLVLSDTLPGILNTVSPGAPAPSHKTPAIAVTTSVTAGSATGICPNLAAGGSALSCNFTNVAPGTTVVVSYAVQRPFAAGILTNTASVSSPNAILGGTLSDSAAVIVAPRTDVAATSKTVTPATPRVGQNIQFTITAQNLGPDDVTAAGDFTVIDDLNTDTTVGTVAFGDIVANGANMSCAVSSSALPGEPPLPATQVRVRCSSTTAVARYSTRTISITARVRKPAVLPASGNAYTNQSNSARVDIPDSTCEWKVETSTNANVSTACNDAASTSNNTRSVNFDVLVPSIDLQQRKTRVLPSGQTSFGVGQPLRYRFRIQNNGPSRAEGVLMTDLMTVPAGFTLSAPQVLNVNGAAAEAGYSLDAGKTGSVSCSQSAPNANLVCMLSGTAANNFLEAGREVNFEVELAQTGISLIPVSFRNEALVCGDETPGYESSGACDRAAPNNNNLASVNDTIFPRTDLSISKATVTPQPVGINQPVEFRLVVSNLGGNDTQQVRVQDVLPPNFELITAAPNAPSLVLGGFVTQVPSTASGATLNCTPTPAAIAVVGQSQTVTCVIDANPGPLGAGAFPGNPNPANTLTLRLFAKPKLDFFTGPYLSDRTNSASVSVGLDGSGNPLSLDSVSANNNSSSPVQVGNASIAGRVFQDRIANGVQDGSLPNEDEGIGNVTITLSGTDAYGNTISRAATTSDTVGATRGSYLFDNLPPGTYRVDETQPAGFVNSRSATPTVGASAPSAGGTYASVGAAGDSSHSAIVLAIGNAAVNYHFPEVRRPSLSGFVYIDNDVNGVRNAGADPAIAGATVRLLNATTGAVVATATTDGTGFYNFPSLDPFITYSLEEPLPAAPAGLRNGPVNPGLIGGTPCAGCTAQAGVGGSTADRIAGIDLSSGFDGTLFNFGEIANGTISGTVYSDRNRSNTMEPSPTDGRLAGVTLTLHAGNSCAGVLLATTTTDALGGYAFPDRAAGQDYAVCETQPAGYGDGTTHPGTNGTSTLPNVIVITNLPNIGSPNNNFGEVAASLSGFVFLDANNDGIRVGDIGGAGVTVTLSGLDAGGSPVNRSTATDASGAWRFDDLPAANGAGYTVTEQLAQPVIAGLLTVNGKTTVGSLGGTATAVDTVPSAIRAIPLPAGGSSVENNFGEVWPQQTSISGVVYLDRNRNLTMDALPTDDRLGGVVLTLYARTGCTGASLATATTLPNGTYRFAGLAVGQAYSVCETQPAIYADGSTHPGDSGISSQPDRIDIAVLPAAGSAGNNFGEVPASIAGHVYLDMNNDGARAGDPGLAGVSVTLTGTDLAGNTVRFTTTTDTQGAWAFDQLPASDAAGYTVTEQRDPPLYNGTVTSNGLTTAGSLGGTATPVATLPSAIAGIVLPAGSASIENNFGERLAIGAISGRVWLDDNNNGRIDGAERGIAGVTLELTGTDGSGLPVARSTVTDSEGRYRFDNLAPGTYSVTEPTQPTGTGNGVTLAGTITGTTVGEVTPVTTLPSVVSRIVLPGGSESIDNNFGEVTNAPDLVVTKAANDAAFTVGRASGYTLRVRNSGQSATNGPYTVTDRLPVGSTLSAAPSGPGWSCTGAVGASSFTCTSSAVLAANTDAPAIVAPVAIGTAAAASSPALNAVMVEGGGEPDARKPTPTERDAVVGNPGVLAPCTAAINQGACRTSTPVQLPAAISGTVWLDQGTKPALLDTGDRRLPGWRVEIVDPATQQVVASTVTGPDGRYRIGDLVPGLTYAVRFRDPTTGIVYGYPVNGETAPDSSGASCVPSAVPSSCVVRGIDPHLVVVLAPGQELTQQSLPVKPTGVVYDSTTRQPVTGAVVTLAPVGSCPGWSPGQQVAGVNLGGYVVNGASISMTTGTNGQYQWLLLPNAPAACDLRLSVTPPPGYTFESTLIPPATDALRPSGPVDTVVAVQPQPEAPTGPVGPGTTYHLTVAIGSGTPGLVYNHIPLDPSVPAGLLLRKSGDRQLVELGDTVRYSITLALTSGAAPRHVTVVDRLPAGFTYVAGTASVDGRPIADPAGAPGPNLAFEVGAMPASGSLTLVYRARAGVGSQQGDGINRATGVACNTGSTCVTPGSLQPLPRSTPSNEAVYQVKVVGGVFTADACVLGKVFVDCNGNHLQDAEELGIPGVRLVLQDGTTLVSDVEGKYSVCGLPPRSAVLRIDPLTLPRGARLTTSSNRNLGDAGSLWLDLKNGELHRADFIEGSCSNTVLEQVKARRAQGEVSAPETEKRGQPALRFDSKAHGLDTLRSPQQGTDGANQQVPKTRPDS
ncbi:SdrD B-like domain-containing protein, partial [Ideonella sp. A 288]|uniref:SdrD B-like domain-containing protein n=1 Tax=Ideonella sp. A 288 TaxID=1962181 RepID=UPI000B4B5D70